MSQPFDLITSEPENAVKIVKELVAMYYKIDHSLIESKSKKEQIVIYRHIVIYVANTSLGIDTVKLGRIFGNKHSNIVAIKKKLNGFLTWNKKLRGEVEEINKILKKIIQEKILDKNLFYYIPLKDFHSIKLEENKAIILKGFTQEEINSIKLVNKYNGKEYISIFEPVKHNNQDFYILEKNEKDNNTS